MVNHARSDLPTNLAETGPGATSGLAPVFMDDRPVPLPNEVRPSVAAVVAASGKRIDLVRVVLLAHAEDPDGAALAPQDVIDRGAGPDAPIFLRCFAKAGIVLPPIVAAIVPPHGTVFTPPTAPAPPPGVDEVPPVPVLHVAPLPLARSSSGERVLPHGLA